MQVRPEDPHHQQLVDRYFETSTPFWEAIYERRDLHSSIYQERKEVVLAMIGDLTLLRDSQVLEVGCGAGITAVSLAERYRVEALDALPAMLDLTRQRADSAGFGHRLQTRLGDANDLPYDDGAFDLTLAIGVLPWVRNISRALGELVRVVRPGGFLVVSIDNSWALQRVLDPLLNPLFRPIKQACRDGVWALGMGKPQAREETCGPRRLTRLLARSGLTTISGKTVGFGPFSLFGHPILPDSFALGVHRKLQSCADRNWPLFGWVGSHYVVCVRKQA
ncbi:MAG: methyltransferase domain-containing protein [Acidobacteriota bacterium]|nr:methyltransferase domain-containing protein [Acidobacteriota bacterium]